MERERAASQPAFYERERQRLGHRSNTHATDRQSKIGEKAKFQCEPAWLLPAFWLADRKWLEISLTENRKGTTHSSISQRAHREHTIWRCQTILLGTRNEQKSKIYQRLARWISAWRVGLANRPISILGRVEFVREFTRSSKPTTLMGPPAAHRHTGFPNTGLLAHWLSAHRLLANAKAHRPTKAAVRPSNPP